MRLRVGLVDLVVVVHGVHRDDVLLPERLLLGGVLNTEDRDAGVELVEGRDLLLDLLELLLWVDPEQRV